MSDVQSRPSASRGRSSARGGRGGYSSRGPRSKVNGHNGAGSIDASTEEGELGELRQQYDIQLKTIKDTFPDWTDLDLLLALHDSDGDLQLTSERILEGQISQFADVPKKSDRSRSKIKDSTAADTAPSTASTRGRGQSSRGGRGRGAERGRGGFRGRGGAHAPNGSRNATGGGASVPTNESSAWDATPSADAQGTPAWDKPTGTETKDGAAEGQWNNATTSEAAPAAATEGAKNASVPEAQPKKTWASMFAKPKPAPAPPKPVAAAPPPEPAEPAPAPVQEEPEPVKEETPPAAQTEELPIPPVADEAPAAEPVQPAAEPPVAIPAVAEPTPANLAPPKEELTEDNVERIPDASVPAPTGTAASTVASGSAIGVATPLTGPKGGAGGRPPMGGFQTSALKATGVPGRSSSFQRKVVEQQEAVVMPGNHAVDRAAVQFGSMGLNGEPDLDVDEDREEAETRTQPPQHSPTQQPRTSLPPAPRQPSGPTEPQIQDSVPTPKQAPGLPPPVAQAQQPIAPQQQSPAVGTQAAQPYSQFGRYGQPVMHSEPAAQTQKPYDPFGAPVSQPSQFDAFPTSQAQTMPQAQASLGAFSTAPNDYSSYYTSDQQRNAYQNYYGAGYGQQAGGSQQETDASQRAGSAFGPTTGEATFPTSQSQQAPGRYGDAHNSGQNTPAPTMAAQHTAAAQSQHLNQPHGHAGHNAGFPYGGPAHPYYSSPYYANYMSQYGGGYGQNYGAPFGGKGMYAGAHHGYGMSPATTYDTHAASPANVGGFGASSMHGRDNALGAAGLGDYGRSNSTQPAQAQQHTASSGAFGGMPDVFARNQSMFPGQNQAYGQQQPGSQAGNDDALKPFGEKAAPGPSPSSIGQPGRPGSATNNSVGQGAQTGLPPPQSHQQGFGGYPGSQYGLSGLGGAHQGGQSYGGYGGFGGGYGGYSARGGWGGNYGH
ncbi:uncharacterized protein K452DRAFT_356240 [Aplosporella prunicola CBS 121167]|uniref:CUE domain-containing protein n=1 Tax=Aplosporella prunicola CBS 121167 TaxID=1176127 RepID=A0A6A6BL91_9PEZI|nr:uncharacterized protein K452DRAFT_356240 [Aplosporella prunicola CBS 121167]KAF2144880.1 hypothetical protein K452DRAFT_356240 [Aplosporella prunicola CBS 121167]